MTELAGAIERCVEADRDVLRSEGNAEAAERLVREHLGLSEQILRAALNSY